MARALTELNVRAGRRYRWERRLHGGEQRGAHLVVEDGAPAVLTCEPAGWRADRVLRAYPAVVDATARGWRAARWWDVGRLDDGSAFVLQEHVSGVAVTRLDPPTVRAVLATNRTQEGLAFAGAPDDAARLEAVLRGDHEWHQRVATFTAAGAALVEHGDEVLAWAGRAPIPHADVIHGDHSSTNLLVDDTGSVRLVDCGTVGRGSRVRDLADLYRQTFVYPSAGHTGSGLLHDAAVAIEGPQVFARCAVAVTYANLAWWVENRSAAQFDQACARLHRLFSELRQPS